jgi:predicted outer membrane protein
MTGRRPAPPFRENSDDVGTRIGAATILGFMAHSALAQAVAEQDQEFAQKAAEGGLMEVQLGQLAQQQAKDQQVVQFGQRMVQDHGQANEKLMAIAEQKAIQLPQELSGDAQQKYEEMQQLSGAEFDEAYMDEMVEDHEKDIELFKQQVESGEDRICAPLRRRPSQRSASTWNSQSRFSRRLRQREEMAWSRSTPPDWAEQTLRGDAASDYARAAKYGPRRSVRISGSYHRCFALSQ